MSWYDTVITMVFGQAGETGTDFATPLDTPITALQGGTVTRADINPWGGEVQVLTTLPGIGQVTEYYRHLDLIQPDLHVGDIVAPGQQVGLSGGQLVGGTNVADPLYSSGPHTEFGIIQNGTFLDPTGLIAATRAGSGTGIGGSGSSSIPTSTGSGGSATSDLLKKSPLDWNWGAGLNAWVSGILNTPSDVAKTLNPVTQATAAAELLGRDTRGFWADHATPWLIQNAIPFLVAALVVIVVMQPGPGGSQSTPAAPRPAPVPVPV